jgi:hypothetical protein
VLDVVKHANVAQYTTYFERDCEYVLELFVATGRSQSVGKVVVGLGNAFDVCGNLSLRNITLNGV